MELHAQKFLNEDDKNILLSSYLFINNLPGHINKINIKLYTIKDSYAIENWFTKLSKNSNVNIHDNYYISYDKIKELLKDINTVLKHSNEPNIYKNIFNIDIYDTFFFNYIRETKKILETILNSNLEKENYSIYYNFI